MSSLIVEVCPIDDIKPHPNAERLELAIVKGWQCVVPKGQYQPGSPITYIPVDAVLPVELSDQLGVTKYLSKGRVKCAKLRGEPSFGVVAPPRGDIGQDVAELLGITKYVPPVKMTAGDAEADHPLFEAYTDIENMRNFPNVLLDGEEVVATEKIHGTNSRIGIIEGERMAGSKGVRRKWAKDSLYWSPWGIAGVADMLNAMEGKQIILYGEIYGRVQSLRYGLPNSTGYRAFDMKVDGRYMDHDAFVAMCTDFGVAHVPLIYRGPYGINTIRSIAEGESAIPGAAHIREGVVVRPIRERINEKVGRVILKYVSDAYLLGDQDGADEL